MGKFPKACNFIKFAHIHSVVKSSEPHKNLYPQQRVSPKHNNNHHQQPSLNPIPLALLKAPFGKVRKLKLTNL
jgi:hypothetical protein